MKCLVSICIIVRDAEKTIRAMLDSLDIYGEIIIVDTGSVDDTIRIIEDEYEITVHRFEWCDDFAAARNYAFGLAQGKWRGYIDADDLFPDSDRLEGTIDRIEDKYGDNGPNALSIPYKYATGHTHQDVVRFVRWADGWRWENEIHENLVRVGGQRIISSIDDMAVIHNKSPADGHASFERNERIIYKVLAKPDITEKKRALFEYHLIQHHIYNDDLDEALVMMHDAQNAFAGTNLAVYAFSDEVVKIHIARGDLDAALEAAGKLAARQPEFREGAYLLSLVHGLKKSWDRCAAFYAEAMRRTELPLRSIDDVWLTRGLVPAHAALAYLALGRDLDANEALSRVAEEAMRSNALVHELAAKARTEIMRREGIRRLKAWTDFCLWASEPQLAVRQTLNLPAALHGSPEAITIRNDIAKRVAHIKSWEAYKAAYATTREESFDDEPGMLDLERAKAVVRWARDNKDKRLDVLSIGALNCTIEAAMMRACPGMHMTIADVAPQASRGIARLGTEFPGRVTSHAVEKSVLDWYTEGTRYDAVMLFEVIEHVPNAHSAVEACFKALSPGGHLFLSTPAAHRWIEPKHAEPMTEPMWHVSAFSAETLFNLISYGCAILDCDVARDIIEASDGTLVASASACARDTQLDVDGNENTHDIVIVVPGTPQPFDALSCERGFVGGSEECVIHLANALRQRGHRVTVYTPRLDGFPIHHVHNSVVWHDIAAFDPHTVSMLATVLYWRCPTFIDPTADHLKVLWLHDAYYNASPSAYQNADGVLVLSESHAKSIAEHDKFYGPFTRVTNGIVADDFPPITDDAEREPHRVIYASSPDRGLIRLLEIWPAVRKEVPDATLEIYYDWTGFETAFPEEAVRLHTRVRDLAADGVRFHGGVDHMTLHTHMRRAGVWAYPTDGEVETFCITAVKAIAAGCDPVYTDAGALRQTTLGLGTCLPTPSSDDFSLLAYCDALIHALKNPPSVKDREVRRLFMLRQYAWDVVAKHFTSVIEDIANAKREMEDAR